MIDDFSNITSLFAELDVNLKKNADVFLIGGGALMRYGLRDHTKDIDIVVSSEEEYNDLTEAFRSIGFVKQVPEIEYGRMAMSDILIRGEYRVDLFCQYVCGKFALSKKMRERAIPVLALNRLKLSVCSLSDIFLFKSMTERIGDIEDCFNMAAEYELDWDAVSDEAEIQSAGDHGVWITWITERMELLSERKIRIPILERMIALSDEYMGKLEKEIEEQEKNRRIIPGQ